MNTLELIEHYGIAIRQIPREVVCMFNFDGNEDRIHQGVKGELIEIEASPQFHGYIRANRQDSPAYRITESTVYRRFIRFRTIPANAGYWMTQENPGTSSTMKWDSRKHNLAPTLGESVKLCVKGIIGD